MGSTLNSSALRELHEGNLEWLEKQGDCLESRHIKMILKEWFEERSRPTVIRDAPYFPYGLVEHCPECGWDRFYQEFLWSDMTERENELYRRDLDAQD